MSVLDELSGLTAELASCITRGKTERADQVRVALRSKRAEAVAEAERLEAQAEGHVANGQDVLAGHSLAAARVLRSGLESLAPVEIREEPAATPRGKRVG